MASREDSLVPSNGSSKRTLVAFDFDHTIVDENTDTFFLTLLDPVHHAPAPKYEYEMCWTDHMAAVFRHLQYCGVSSSAIKERLLTIPLTPGMLELLTYLGENPDKYEPVIISDSNSLFIPWILSSRNLLCPFAKQMNLHSQRHSGPEFGKLSGIYTNPGWIDEKDCICLEYFHTNNWCDVSAKNMCKGAILRGLVDWKEPLYEQVVFVGDGSNDFCPTSRLRKEDCVAVRRGYALEKMVSKNPVQAQVLMWSDARQIVELLKSL